MNMSDLRVIADVEKELIKIIFLYRSLCQKFLIDAH